MEVVRIDLEKCYLFDDLSWDRLEWRNKIHIVEPNIVVIGFDDDDEIVEVLSKCGGSQWLQLCV